jgi:AraC-like DNA-binding protein
MLTKKIPSQDQLMPFANDLQSGAKHFNKSTRTIRRWLKKREIYHPQIKYRPGKVDEKKACEIRRLNKIGLTQAEIGSCLKLSQTTVGRIINKDANLTLGGEVVVKLFMKPTEQNKSS